MAERPPPSHLQPVSTSSGSVALPSGRFNGRISSRMGARSTSHASSSVVGDEHRRNRAAGGMRNSPLFRALDGMVVGTMTIPFNVNIGPSVLYHFLLNHIHNTLRYIFKTYIYLFKMVIFIIMLLIIFTFSHL